MVKTPDFSIVVELEGKTGETLASDGYSLYGLKAVETAVKDAEPVVWFVDKDVAGDKVTVDWHASYGAFTALAPFKDGAVITPKTNVTMPLGETLLITGSAGSGDRVDRGFPGATTIENAQAIRFTCGPTQVGPSGALPPCACNLRGVGHKARFVPVESVLLMFSQETFDPGTVLSATFAPGLLVHMRETTTRTVKYHIGTGWKWEPEEAGWAARVEDAEPIKDMLVRHTAHLA